eukprot:12890757-Prorocentrum_lima.AAC.1
MDWVTGRQVFEAKVVLSHQEERLLALQHLAESQGGKFWPQYPAGTMEKAAKSWGRLQDCSPVQPTLEAI